MKAVRNTKALTKKRKRKGKCTYIYMIYFIAREPPEQTAAKPTVHHTYLTYLVVIEQHARRADSRFHIASR